ESRSEDVAPADGVTWRPLATVPAGHKAVNQSGDACYVHGAVSRIGMLPGRSAQQPSTHRQEEEVQLRHGAQPCRGSGASRRSRIGEAVQDQERKVGDVPWRGQVEVLGLGMDLWISVPA